MFLSLTSSLYNPDINVNILIGRTFEEASFNPLKTTFNQCGGAYDQILSGTLFYIHCFQTLVGRYIVVHMDALATALKICEIEVYQDQGRNAFFCGHNTIRNTSKGKKTYVFTVGHQYAQDGYV